MKRADYLPAQLVGKLINPLNQSGGSFASDVYIGALCAAQRNLIVLSLLLLLGLRGAARDALCYGKLNMN